MSAASFSRAVDQFCANCLSSGVALNVSHHIVKPIGNNRFTVKWSPTSQRAYRRTPDLDLKEYLDCLRHQDFSILLMDGGIIQVSADFTADTITESRFYYIPCPIRFEKGELNIGDEIYPLEDFIEELSPDEIKERLCIRAPFRFELDPANERERHPKSHVHIGPSSSRIPLAASMCWNSFSRFIFRNFYSSHFEGIAPLLQHPVSYREPTISDDDQYEVHMTFRTSR